MDARLIVMALTCLTAVIGCILAYFKFSVDDKGHKSEVDLAVCILSGRENFDLRNAVRQTWLKDFSRSAVAKFIVGSSPCDIHPDYRLDPYSCEPWDISLPEDKSESLAAFSVTARQTENEDINCIVTSMTFLVMHDIILKRVGILDTFPFYHLGDDFQVVIYDSISEEEISRSRFTASYKGSVLEGFRYKSVEGLILPKNYQFTVTLEAEMLEHIPQVVDTQTIQMEGRQSHHGLLSLQSKKSMFVSPTGYQDNCTAVPLLSLMFSVADGSSLDELVGTKEAKTRRWTEDREAAAARLAQEVEEHQDIVVVELVDIYRKLPQKLLSCHQWIYENYEAQFVMKTDDDVYLNVTNVLSGLANMDSSKSLWWGSFRANWQVERHGKWRENDYTPDVYPDFACGSGNIISAPVHKLLVRNKDCFRLFQGEDVSMGIWLAAFNVTYIRDPRWRCDKKCVSDFISLPQLDVDNIYCYGNNSLVPGLNPCQICGLS